ncbi:type 1 fimbrial protein [Salmonella enterica subsp. enterica serovar Altona]|nr:type 1 fimbrial protein [Salmonella enterica subsp. enterica serovar Altona]
MSVIRTAFILGFALSVQQNASAACMLTTQKIIASPESVAAKRAVQSGGVIQTRTHTLHNVQNAGCTDSQSFTAQVMGDQSAISLPGILRSNVNGIGIKVTLETSTGRTIQWPSAFSATPDEFRNGKVNIELIKLDNNLPAHVAPGPLNLQIRSDAQSLPVVNIVLPAKYIMLLNQSCSIKGNRIINVNLPEVPIEHFRGRGTTAGMKPFSIDLLCKSDFKTHSRVKMNWSDIHNGRERNIGVLPNIQHRGAAGIGIQVLDSNQKPINFSKPSHFNVTYQENETYTIPFHARYYQTDSKVSPGNVRSVLYFNAEYE